ncbi:cytochrome c [Rosistilla oblonga]|uniref:Cytochrome C n=1 Tax=Rosistilla oblonga TaxID=2527990 RepID=A0A518IN89_9BACT|nr:cytochrome c [Rosistilla oblonga]QDV54564.1 Cytochrome C' [Rosistilla oblonga]
MIRHSLPIVALALLQSAAAPLHFASDAAAQSPPAAADRAIAAHRVQASHLPNPVQIGDKVISGGLPEDEQAFAELRSLGVKTIISVDGARPDVAMASRFGLRYVHLPHGYNGIPSARVQELAKAVRDLEGPIYIHCHHGKHRSPAAATVACVAAGQIPAGDATAILQLAGTSPNYQGLYRAAKSAQPIATAELDALQVRFEAQVSPPPMVEQMIAIEQTHDNLKRLAAADWKVSDKHPDLDPAHEALLMREHFTEMLRDRDAPQSQAFQQSIRDSRDAAAGLEAAIRQGLPNDVRRQFTDRIEANCKSCHRQFRDIPLAP